MMPRAPAVPRLSKQKTSVFQSQKKQYFQWTKSAAVHVASSHLPYTNRFYVPYLSTLEPPLKLSGDKRRGMRLLICVIHFSFSMIAAITASNKRLLTGSRMKSAYVRQKCRNLPDTLSSESASYFDLFQYKLYKTFSPYEWHARLDNYYATFKSESKTRNSTWLILYLAIVKYHFYYMSFK